VRGQARQSSDLSARSYGVNRMGITEGIEGGNTGIRREKTAGSNLGKHKASLVCNGGGGEPLGNGNIGALHRLE